MAKDWGGKTYDEDFYEINAWGERQSNEKDWKADNDWDWRSAANDTPEQLRELWRRAVDGARKDLVEALRRGDLSQPAKRAPWRDGRVPSLRWILTHMIEEYSRHNGHADLIREAIDGQTGE
jgi:hypothetical protein